MPYFSHDNHGNSLFESSVLVSPATTNLISMKKMRTDRTKFGTDFLAKWFSLSDTCQASPDPDLNRLSSIPTEFYNQQHCTKSRKINVFEEKFNCSVMTMLGTNDLNPYYEMCNGTIMQGLMDFIENIEVEECPPACIDETVELTQSFTLLSDDLFNRAIISWNLPTGLPKEEAVWIDIYYGSKQTMVYRAIFGFYSTNILFRLLCWSLRLFQIC